MAVCIEMCCVRMILPNYVCLKSHIEWMDMTLKWDTFTYMGVSWNNGTPQTPQIDHF